MIGSQQVGRAFVVTLSQPPVNAINDAWIDRFDGALDAMERRGSTTVLHIRSDQRVFSAGADLKTMRSCFTTPDGPDKMVAMVRRLQALYARIERLPQVTVTEIGGSALGGGFELALACDLRVASLDARLGLPEARLGLIPGAGGTQRLARLCGSGVARRMILSAELVDGEAARSLGIVQWAVALQELSEFTTKLVASVAALPPAALAACKRCISQASEPGPAGFLAEVQETHQLLDDPETRALVTAFLERRPMPRTSDLQPERKRVAP
ncbi:MAG: enoyl-CoA hydratase/isomerase family protein [Alphaproteobacteria bacterium]|nr:enoyl-CoA hydratase/isomerase family protein [Alphaproteobacteria bacterium]